MSQKYPLSRRPCRLQYGNTKKDFIEPLFEALGWDVRNKDEVDAEKHVRPGFADYAFLLDGLVQFYLEAKALDDNIYKEEYELPEEPPPPPRALSMMKRIPSLTKEGKSLQNSWFGRASIPESCFTRMLYTVKPPKYTTKKIIVRPTINRLVLVLLVGQANLEFQV